MLYFNAVILKLPILVIYFYRYLDEFDFCYLNINLKVIIFCEGEFMDNKDKEIDNKNKPKIKKTLEQRIASAQLRLNRLQHKSKEEAKKVETRQKIILGAEVAKALNCDVFSVDKELVLGMMLAVKTLTDEEKVQFRKDGMMFLAKLVGRKL